MTKKLTISFSAEINDKLERLASRLTSGNKSELLRRAVMLMEVSEIARQDNETLAFVDKNTREVKALITGV